MPYLLEVPLEDGETMLVEVTGQADGLAPVGRGREVIGQLPESFTTGLDRAQKFTEEVLTRMRRYTKSPDRVTVEFGLKLSAKAGVIIAESAGEAHLKVTAEWSRTAFNDRPADASEESESGSGEVG